MIRLARAFAAVALVVLGGLASSSARADDDEWAEWTTRWDQLTVVVRTDAGVYSPAIQAIGMDGGAKDGAPGPAKLMDIARTYFVMTSAPRVDHTFEFIEPLARKWGPGHALPIIAAVALENVQRPMPSLFGGAVVATTIDPGGKLVERASAGIDPKRPGTLRIVVHGRESRFREAAARAAHASAKAYYDAARNEVGLLLDMAVFRRFYAGFDGLASRRPAMVSAFVAYAMDAFNEDSGHELAHVAQRQAARSAYALPAIREGEAEVQGLTRRRNGLVFDFVYNTPDAWTTGRFDMPRLEGRLGALDRIGRPMSPNEVDRLVLLKVLSKDGRALKTGPLLAMDDAAFFAGLPADIEARYAQSWALCLLAIREKPVATLLIQAIDARLAKVPRADLEARIDQRLSAFLADPHELKVSKETAWRDAEAFFAIDRIFVGVFYEWIHVIDPQDMKALVYLGDALYKGGNLHGAMRHYLAARRLDDRSALPLLRIGDVEALAGNRAAALRAWKDAEATGIGSADEALLRQAAKDRPQVQLR